MLEKSDDPNVIGTLSWKLALALLGAWIMVFLCIAKGVKSSGKVVYFTAIFPYLMLTVLLIRGAMLEGAGEGIEFYLKPDPKKLLNFEVIKYCYV